MACITETDGRTQQGPCKEIRLQLDQVYQKQGQQECSHSAFFLKFVKVEVKAIQLHFSPINELDEIEIELKNFSSD